MKILSTIQKRGRAEDVACDERASRGRVRRAQTDLVSVALKADLASACEACDGSGQGSLADEGERKGRKDERRGEGGFVCCMSNRRHILCICISMHVYVHGRPCKWRTCERHHWYGDSGRFQQTPAVTHSKGKKWHTQKKTNVSSLFQILFSVSLLSSVCVCDRTRHY